MDRLAVAVLNLETERWSDERITRTLDRIGEAGRRILPSNHCRSPLSFSTGMPFGIPDAQQLSLSLP